MVRVRGFYAFPRFVHNFFTLKKNLRIEPCELAKIQEKKLKAIVGYAYNNVPFYHRLFKANQIKPYDIKTLSDLKRIPIINRKIVQENLDDMVSVSVDVAKCAKKKTSGSRGVPLTVIRADSANYFRMAISIRHFLECGGRLRDKQVELREPGASSLPENWKKPFYEYLGLLRIKWIKTGEIFDELIPFLEKYKPDILVGYPGFLQLLAEKSSGLLRSRIIFTTGEIMSDSCRRLLRSTFGASVMDSYGCAEVGDIAWECPEGHQGYHINADAVLAEFVQNGESVAAGEEGEVVLTSLFSHAMPFIRYNIGDVGIPSDEQCSCGRTLPLMRLLKGRSDDFIILPDGRKLSPLGMINIQDFVGISVSEIMIIQETKNLIEVLLKMQEEKYTSRVKESVLTLQKIVGPDVNVKVRFVKEIARNSSGKFRRVISKVSNPHN